MESNRKRSRTSRGRGLLAGIAAAISLLVAPVGIAGILVPSTAHAVVGRPATPVSYAGTARRTSRRTSRRVSSRQAALYSLPAGCTLVGGIYQCGGTSYQQVVDGADVVYIEVDD